MWLPCGKTKRAQYAEAYLAYAALFGSLGLPDLYYNAGSEDALRPSPLTRVHRQTDRTGWEAEGTAGGAAGGAAGPAGGMELP